MDGGHPYRGGRSPASEEPDRADRAFLAAASAVVRLEVELREALGERWQAAAYPMTLLRAAIAAQAYGAMEAAILEELGDAADPVLAPMAAIRGALLGQRGELVAPVHGGPIDTQGVLDDLEDVMEALLIQRRG